MSTEELREDTFQKACKRIYAIMEEMEELNRKIRETIEVFEKIREGDAPLEALSEIGDSKAHKDDVMQQQALLEEATSSDTHSVAQKRKNDD